MRKYLFILLLPAVLFACSPRQAADPVERKVDSLLSLMTFEEKVGQIAQYNGGWINEEVGERVRQGLVGSMLNSADPDEIAYYQHIAVEETRLGIPLIFARDIIHGFRTIYPIPLGQAATWNPNLVERAAMLTAIEATQTGIRWTFSPMVDVARDPRWGRIAEGYGEDTYLTSVMGAATVRGYQQQDLQAPNALAACVKHFAAYGASEGGRDYNTTNIPEVILRETYLPPFKACVDADAASLMCSFNEINGVPSSANVHLNRDILRDEWGYTGLMCSDWASSENMISHGNAANWKDATEQSIHARIEVDMPGVGYVKYCKELLDEKRITMAEIDDCVRSVLRMKFRLGVFDHPYAYQPEGKPVYYSDESLAAAREAAEESAILMKNNGALPLAISNAALLHQTTSNAALLHQTTSNAKPQTIYLCGPMLDAQHDQNGTWVFDAVDSMTVTPLMAFQQNAKLQTPSNPFKLTYQKGKHWSREVMSDSEIAALCREAAGSDVVVYFAGEESILSGEARCRAHLDLPGNQLAQLQALRKALNAKHPQTTSNAAGTKQPQTPKLVLVVMAGRPLCISRELELADAVLYAYHGGTMQGPALYNLLTGAVVPSGKTTNTFLQAEGQIPLYYNRKNTGRPASRPVLLDEIAVGAGQFSIGESSYWLEYGDKPLLPFGYGLSYSSFEYGPTRVSLSRDGEYVASEPDERLTMAAGYNNVRDSVEAVLTMSASDTLFVQCEVTNTGRYDAKEVVQLYIRDVVGQLARPVCELKGFDKPLIRAGETVVVTFPITVKDLSYWHLADGIKLGADGAYVFSAEPGKFFVSISPNAATHRPTCFSLK